MSVMSTFWTLFVGSARVGRERRSDEDIEIKVEDFIHVIRSKICNNPAGRGDGCLNNHDPRIIITLNVLLRDIC